MRSEVTYTTSPANGINIWYFLMAVAVGAAALKVAAVVSVAWAVVIIVTLFAFIKDRMEWLWYCVAMSPVLEVWSRMVAAPFMPYEVGKYFLLAAIVLLFLHHSIRQSSAPLYKAGLLILVALAPGLLVALAVFDHEEWVFNVLGILELSLLLIFTARERWHIERLCKTLQYSLLAMLAFVVYITLRSPVGGMEFSLKANAGAAGGFGSNQVSTLLGAGVVVAAVLMLLKRPFFSIGLFNYAFLAYLLFRGLLTFSRGGMVVAVVAVLIAILFKMFSNVKMFLRYSALLIVLAVVGYFMFGVVNDMTGNMLLQRYKGETQGTLAGKREKDLNVMLSGRQQLAATDLELFKENIAFGVGPGGAKHMRKDFGYEDEVAAHTEFSRLLSEHGIGGLLAGIIMLIFPLVWLSRQKIFMWKGIVAALFTLAILTTFHAAMRTNTAIVFYVLAAIPVFYNRQVLKNEQKR